MIRNEREKTYSYYSLIKDQLDRNLSVSIETCSTVFVEQHRTIVIDEIPLTR
jgi:hypothetical protein